MAKSKGFVPEDEEEGETNYDHISDYINDICHRLGLEYEEYENSYFVGFNAESKSVDELIELQKKLIEIIGSDEGFEIISFAWQDY